MTRSDLIERIAKRYPQLQFKDADLAVKVILEALTE
jgi:nucleoid DNA-binding protein